MVSEPEMDRTLFAQQEKRLDNVGQRSVVHIFEKDLEKANENVSWLIDLYKQIFWNYIGHKYYADNMEFQKLGIDLVISLSSGQKIKIDEKRRHEVYSDIALEYAHTNGSKGWIEKTLAIDYLAYIQMPKQQLFLFPWLLLRMAWRKYGDDWKKIYRCFPSQNVGYQTWNVGVPNDILWRAMREVSFIRLGRI